MFRFINHATNNHDNKDSVSSVLEMHASKHGRVEIANGWVRVPGHGRETSSSLCAEAGELSPRTVCAQIWEEAQNHWWCCKPETYEASPLIWHW